MTNVSHLIIAVKSTLILNFIRNWLKKNEEEVCELSHALHFILFDESLIVYEAIIKAYHTLIKTKHLTFNRFNSVFLKVAF
jgi:hypothetical protein